MTALLILLGLLSVATIASRPGPFAAALDRIAAPLLIGSGLALGPLGLGVVSASLRGGLEQALAGGVTWLGIVLGLRSSSIDLQQGTLPRAIVVVAAATGSSVLVATAALATPALIGWQPPLSSPLIGGSALVIGGAVVGTLPVGEGPGAVVARGLFHDCGELVATACAIAAVAVLPSWTGVAASIVAVVVIGVGLLLAGLQRFLGGGAGGDAETRLISLLGVVAVAAGLLHEVGLPSALSGLVAGLALGRTALGRALGASLLPTERPARIVVLFLIGAMTSMSTSAVLIGGILALGQLVVHLIATSWAVGRSVNLGELAAGLGSSSIAVVIAASFSLAGFPEGALLVSSSAVAVIVTDLVAAGLLLRGRWGAAMTALPKAAR